MICSQCGTENKPGDKFCEQCGSPLGAPTGAPAVAGAFGATVVAAPSEPCVMVRLDGTNSEPVVLGSRAVVGRLDTCDIPVDDKSVSREHARLSRLRDGYVIEDLGSTNGTLVNGRRIDEAVILRPGDIVTVGSIDFRFDLQRTQQARPAGAASEPAADHDGISGESSFSPFAPSQPPSWGGTPVQTAPFDTAPAPAEEQSPWSPPPFAAPAEPEAAAPPPSSVTDISFPPLEPFGAAEQEPPPAIPKFADAFTASEEPETTEAKEEEAAPPVTAEAPPEQAPEEGKEAPQPVAEAPRSIAMPEIEEKSAAVAPPEEAPQPRRSAPPVDDTSEMAEQLTGFLQDMGRQLRESREGQRQAEEQLARLQAQHDDIRRRLQDSEDALSARSQRLQNVQDELRAAQTDLQDARATIAAKQEKLDAVRNALSEVPSLSVPQDQMDELQGLIESLVQNPNHVEYLAQTAKRASLISSVVQEASGLRTLVTRLNEQVASD